MATRAFKVSMTWCNIGGSSGNPVYFRCLDLIRPLGSIFVKRDVTAGTGPAKQPFDSKELARRNRMADEGRRTKLSPALAFLLGVVVVGLGVLGYIYYQ